MANNIFSPSIVRTEAEFFAQSLNSILSKMIGSNRNYKKRKKKKRKEKKWQRKIGKETEVGLESVVAAINKSRERPVTLSPSYNSK